MEPPRRSGGDGVLVDATLVGFSAPSDDWLGVSAVHEALTTPVLADEWTEILSLHRGERLPALSED